MRPPKKPRPRPLREPPPRRKKPKKKKQVSTPPTARMKELIEEVLEAISDLMSEGRQWVSDHNVQAVLRRKDLFDNLEDKEVRLSHLIRVFDLIFSFCCGCYEGFRKIL